MKRYYFSSGIFKNIIINPPSKYFWGCIGYIILCEDMYSNQHTYISIIDPT